MYKCISFVLLSLNILSEKEELTQGAPFKQQSEANQSNASEGPIRLIFHTSSLTAGPWQSLRIPCDQHVGKVIV